MLQRGGVELDNPEILVVEDDPLVQNVVEEGLSEGDFK
jgi:hypothetical protein